MRKPLPTPTLARKYTCILTTQAIMQATPFGLKAYVVTAENNQCQVSISTPLYVELIDQMGYTTNKQIIKLENGEGYGQIPLTEYVLSGYYEVRAYTKWMLAFNETQYFSRTFPILSLAQR